MSKIQFARLRVSRRKNMNARINEINDSPLAEILRNRFSGFQFSFDQFGFYVKKHDRYYKFNILGTLREMDLKSEPNKSGRTGWGEFYKILPYIVDRGRWFFGPKVHNTTESGWKARKRFA